MNQRGNTFLILLLPVCVTLLLLLSAFGLTIQSWRRSHQICRDSVLQVHQIIHDVTQKMIDMNPKAQLLRLERKHAEEMLKNAANPATAAVAAAHLARVIIKQIAFRAEQTRLKNQVLIQSRQILQKMKDDLEALPIEAFGVIYSYPRLHLTTQPPLDLTPDHARANSFSQKQKLNVHWRFQALNSKWEWLTRLIPRSPVMNGQCTSTILQKENRWFSSLIRANFSSNYLWRY